MAPKKSFGEGSKKRHKSRAQEDEPTTMDNTFRSSEHSVRFHDEISPRTVVLAKLLIFLSLLTIIFLLKSSFKLKGGKTFLVYDKPNILHLSSTSTLIFNIKRAKSLLL